MPAMRLKSLVFALALAVQVLAPIVGGVAAGESARAGLGEICLNAGADIQHDGRTTPGHSHQRDCPVCQAFCDGVAPVEASASTAVSISLARWSALRWRVADSVAPATSGRFAHRARAPPAA